MLYKIELLVRALFASKRVWMYMQHLSCHLLNWWFCGGGEEVCAEIKVVWFKIRQATSWRHLIFNRFFRLLKELMYFCSKFTGPVYLIWYSHINGLGHIDNLDIYVTGSNSRFLSSDILTEFIRKTLMLMLMYILFRVSRFRVWYIG